MNLTLNKLCKTYPGGVNALDDVSLEITPGIFGLLGPNGAGKSTLMRTLATLQKPTSGEAHFGAIDIVKNPAALRQNLGYLPQDFDVYPGVSARKLLDYLLCLKGFASRSERLNAVDDLLDQVNLLEHAERAVSTFSGGMRQRFGIAQALAGDPQLVIVDEPTAGLDPGERNRFHNILATIGERAIVILSTHIVEDVASLCRNTAIIKNGRLVAVGEPKALCAELDGKLWRALIARSDFADISHAHNVIEYYPHPDGLGVVVQSSDHPGDPFKAHTPALHDYYHSLIGQDIR
ncbi:MAG: ABC transporter ATP-binding protein [Pseudomonadota bacterium]